MNVILNLLRGVVAVSPFLCVKKCGERKICEISEEDKEVEIRNTEKTKRDNIQGSLLVMEFFVFHMKESVLLTTVVLL